MLHLKIVYHFVRARWKLMICLYNLTEYSDNCSDTSRSLWQFKRDDVPANDADFNFNSSVFNSESSKYKVALVRKTNAADGNSFVKNTKIVIPSNYLNFGYY